MSSQSRSTLFVTTALTIAIASGSAIAVDRYVDWNASGNNNGTDTDPWTSLQTALANASENDTIHIAQGTYKPGTTRGSSFVISNKNLILRGGYVNNNGTWTHSPSTAETILSGDIGTINTHTDNCYTVLKLSYSGAVPTGSPKTVIEYLTIKHGYANGGGNDNKGAGVRITAGSPRLNHCKIINNSAAGDPGYGGGVFAENASPVLTLCTIENNLAEQEGGGIYCGEAGNFRIINCTIRDNQAYALGGGIMMYTTGPGQDVDVINCLIVGNEAGPCQGQQCLADIEGGGICIQATTNNPATVDIVNCTIVNNHGEDHGGGIKVIGGGQGQTRQLINSIVWGNTSSGNGKEIAIKANGDFVISYSNVRSFDENVYVEGATVGTGVIGDDVDASGNGPHNPKFENSANDFRLQCGSPCINTANNSVLPCDQFDLDGDGNACFPNVEATPDLELAARVFWLGPDMGAYERQKTTSCNVADIVPVPCGDGVVNVNDLLAVINGWGNCPSPPATCPADIAPYPNGDGTVNVNDLLAVINNWTNDGNQCPGATGEPGDMPDEVSDCMELCAEADDYGACMQRCLCAIGYEEACPE